MKKNFYIKTVSFAIIIMIFINITLIGSADKTVQDTNAKTLVKLGIMKGYEDGSLKLENKIKRSEFITLVVNLLGHDKDKDLNGITLKFKDITKKHWAFNNIKLAIKHNLVSGYPDNTIGPDKNVTYAEALAVVIRALGYESSLKGKWPENVINKAKELNLNKNIDIKASQQLTRGNMSIIVYNALTVRSNN